MQPKKVTKSKRLTKQKSGVIRAKSDFFRAARYGLTLQEHRIVYFSILQGQQNGTPFEPVTVSIQEFKELCEVKGENYYSVIRKLSQKMIGKSVEVAYSDEKGYHLLQAPWLIGITYHAKDGTVTIEPNKKLQPFFEGKPFTDTEFYFLVKFTSQYAERLYELIKATSHKKPLVDFEIEDLRKRLSVGDKKYPNFAHLKQYVLEPALADINEYTDLEITMQEKRGLKNKVETVYFAVSKKNTPKLAERSACGEFRPPLSPEEQQIFINELIGVSANEQDC